MAVASPARLLGLEDLAARADRDHLELVCGSIVERAAPSWEHSTGSTRIVELLAPPFNRRPGGRVPGGWWIRMEIHTAYSAHEVFCHDAAGWRRERVHEQPSGWPVRIRPDWVCEVVSPSHEKRDIADKYTVLHAAGVPHYWLLYPEERMLLVHRWTPDGYVRVLTAGRGDTVRPEPFDAIEIRVGELFGDDDVE
jgi:Uma2 family endonuclease